MNTPKTKEEALEMLETINKQANGLREFINNFGKKKPIIERCTSIRAAFEIEGIDYADWLQNCRNNGDQADEIAYKEIKTFARVLNEGWEPDYRNSDEGKYYPYFDMSSGFSFNYGFYYSSTNSYTAARHVFKTDALARFAGCTILETYKRFYKK